MQRINGCIFWGPIFRRNLDKREELQLQSMMTLINGVFIPRDGKDRRIWMASTNGMFTVASLFRPMTRDVLAPHAHVASLWRIKVLAFGWSALLGGILTMVNLRR
eukprot:TRINITY_DN12349_c0_g1_i1.p1 TRINITY_DN12349_c0_g1~~TRINITY_DN12349_c0_g1_i1.p1  ORF type:complete len:105 (+),score=8.41 TRINITY_DN12349_c0_g1_i1:963-1277(+)